MKTFKTKILAILITILITIFTPCFSSETEEITNKNIIHSNSMDNTRSTEVQESTENTDKSIDAQDTINIQKTVAESTISKLTRVQPSVSADGSIKNIDNNIQPQEKRKHIRFNTANINHPVLLKTETNNQLIDISRGGIAIKPNNTLKQGEIFPVKITYKDIIIDTQAKVVSTNNDRIGAEFITQNEDITNQLLYLSVLLESDNNMLGRRINQ